MNIERTNRRIRDHIAFIREAIEKKDFASIEYSINEIEKACDAAFGSY